ncbi:MAG: ABC transporter substrate-binding protein [Treponema sp.]|nr:ABC transporter substrate-binding protein [Treponema sp.]
MKFRTKITLAVSVCVPVVIALSFFFSFLFLSLNGKSSEKSQKRLILGFSQIGSESAWRTRNTQSIFEAAEANGIQILFDDAQQKQENQLKAIRSFIIYQVDVIAFVPIVEDGWDNVLREAKTAGIPVIIVDRQINADKSLYAGFLGENAFEEGEKAGKFLLEKCADEEGRINILEISGTENSSVVKGRAKGFREILKANRKFKIIHSENGDFLRSRGKEIAENLIQKARDSGNFKNDTLYFDGKPIDAIYSHNDSMTLGLLDSFANYGINPADTIIISIDAEQKSIDALVAGKLNCVVECNPNLGEMLMNLVKQVAQGKPVPKITYNKEKVFCEYDDFSKYELRGY